MRAQRSPVRYAFAAVVALLLGAGGLRVWGPVNPAILVSVSGDGFGTSPTAAGADPTLRNVEMVISNHSRSTVTVARVRATRSRDLALVEGRRPEAVPNVESVSADADRAGVVVTRALPYRLAGGESVRLQVVVRVRACTSGPLVSTDYSVVADLRTRSGRTKTVGGDRSGTTAADSCSWSGPLPPLPEPGVQPADPALARAAVASSFSIVYDLRGPSGSQSALIDDPRGIDALGAAAATGPYASNVLAVGVRVDRTIFTDPTHAVVVYSLLIDGSPSFGERIGHARFVDGHWKVTRPTVCADLALAKLTCPPA